MSYFAFDQQDTDVLSKYRRGKSKNPYNTPTSTGAGIGTAYRLDSTTSIDDNTEDGNGSLTYSASSSQAGESTDSSVGDLDILLEKENLKHLYQQKEKSNFIKHGDGNPLYFQREKSARSAVDSLGYSDDDTCDDSIDHFSHQFKSWNQTISGQPSDSYAHDGGSAMNKPGSARKSIAYKKGSSKVGSSPVSVSADLNSCSAGSNGTPNTPPPRHSARKMMTHDEVWYQKWWMCGFTDALNLNPNPQG